MPITMDINRDKKLTVIKVSGIVSFKDLRKSLLDYYKRGATDLIIVDLREAEGSAETYSHDKIFDLAEFVGASQKGRGKGKTALVASKDLYFGICRTIEAIKSDSPIKYRTFRSMEAAVEWIEDAEA